MTRGGEYEIDIAGASWLLRGALKNNEQLKRIPDRSPWSLNSFSLTRGCRHRSDITKPCVWFSGDVVNKEYEKWSKTNSDPLPNICKLASKSYLNDRKENTRRIYAGRRRSLLPQCYDIEDDEYDLSSINFNRKVPSPSFNLNNFTKVSPVNKSPIQIKNTIAVDKSNTISNDQTQLKMHYLGISF
ncbi:unnamed protein product [Phytomonas sp. Hart1]|nr:unnamed protein product [Phytomonas sp. Hart1]|eukprot:CCW72124.1 unnamed protein product [Phytomonas sp. isolate Hart1]